MMPSYCQESDLKLKLEVFDCKYAGPNNNNKKKMPNIFE